MLRFLLTGLLWLSFCATAAAQTPQTAQTQAPLTDNVPVNAIKAPRNPLPSEEASANVTKFSFLVYGDTRGRRDGLEQQYEHSMVVNAMVAQIKRLERTAYPVRFVLQSGDGVANGAGCAVCGEHGDE